MGYEGGYDLQKETEMYRNLHTLTSLSEESKFAGLIKSDSDSVIPLPTPKKQIRTIDEYISEFPKPVQAILENIRQAVKESAPQAEEAMRYGMPTFRLNGNLVHFAAHKNHIGFYPSPSGIDAFRKELAQYKTSKGAIQFPLDMPMPIPLIKKIVKFRVNENTAEVQSTKI